MLSIEAWNQADDASRRAAVCEAAGRISGRVIDLVGAHDERPAYGIVARGSVFAFIPGGTVTLGLEPARWRGPGEHEPLPEEDEAAIVEWVTLACTPVRTVTLAPFLLQITPTPVAPLVDTLPDGVDLLEGIEACVVAEGFRLPTCDEWEHAVRAGATSVFRWGDTWPDGIPYGRETTFRAHRERSALGLALFDDTYQWEIVSSPLGFRGGDGGEAVCGGVSYEETWLVLSPAYRHPRASWEDVIVEALETAHVRRVIPLPA